MVLGEFIQLKKIMLSEVAVDFDIMVDCKLVEYYLIKNLNENS